MWKKTTATGKRSNICQAGLVRVIKGEIHGIMASKTAQELTFDKVWPELCVSFTALLL
jgi:hypothetical protein